MDLWLSGNRARLCGSRGRTFKSCQVHQKIQVRKVLDSVPCGFESLRDILPILWVVAQTIEHRTVTAARESSSLFNPPNLNGTVAERRGTWLSTKPMTVRVRSVPPGVSSAPFKVG